MTGKCLDSGTLQAFLDGELNSAKAEIVAEHIGACDDCAMQFAVAEEESAFAFSALEQEFNTLVPTQRLWTKINDSIEQEKEKRSFWTPIFAFFKQPAFAAFAGLIIIVGLFALVLNRGTVEETTFVAVKNSNEKIVNAPVQKSVATTAPPAPTPAETKLIAASTPANSRARVRVVPANLTKENTNQVLRTDRREVGKAAPSPLPNEALTGEDSYLKTIATLTETVNTRKDEMLKPSARFAFERDMAVADDAIKTMKREIKQNPNDDAARQILRASYQNKIDLLSSVADKTELLASVK